MNHERRQTLKIFAVFNHPDYGLHHHRSEVRAAHLLPGAHYELHDADVGTCFSTVSLSGIPCSFNSVHFDFVDEENRPVDIYAMRQFRNY